MIITDEDNNENANEQIRELCLPEWPFISWMNLILGEWI